VKTYRPNLSKFGYNCAIPRAESPHFDGLERKSLDRVCEGDGARRKGACARGTDRWLRHPHLGTGSYSYIPAASSLTFSHLTCCWGCGKSMMLPEIRNPWWKVQPSA